MAGNSKSHKLFVIFVIVIFVKLLFVQSDPLTIGSAISVTSKIFRGFQATKSFWNFIGNNEKNNNADTTDFNKFFERFNDLEANFRNLENMVRDLSLRVSSNL